jgi:tRNA G18 (ribose-2'-O)-methylase SpoU
MVTDLSATNHTIQNRTRNIGLILGNEGMGVRQAIISKAEHKIKIRMHQTESLNVAVAGSMLM